MSAVRRAARLRSRTQTKAAVGTAGGSGRRIGGADRGARPGRLAGPADAVHTRGGLGRTVRRNLALTATAAAFAGAAVLAGGAPPAAQQAAVTAPTRPVAEPTAACAPGELCLWEKQGYTGTRHTHELASTDIESCIVVPGGGAQSFANRTGRPVTTYQSAECQETGEFDTYPGKGRGTWSPEAPYRVRAFKIWER